MAWRPVGIIAIPASGRVPTGLLDKSSIIPTVLVDRVDPLLSPFDSVLINNIAAGEMAGQYLVNKGHTKILVLASNLSFPPIRDRLLGVRKALKIRGVSSPDVIEIGDNIELGTNMIGKWLENNASKVPTAVFALNYATTLSALSAFPLRGLRIGKGLSFIAFDYSWMSARVIGLTAIRQPVTEIARNSWNRLIERIGCRDKVMSPASIILQASLIERESVENI
ncbi:MAG: substrate-binding domain-containing protein [Ostreibacterium sp.]